MKEQINSGIINILQLKKELLAGILVSTREAIGLLADDKLEEFDCEMQKCSELMQRVDKLKEAAKNVAKSVQQQSAQTQLENEISYILNEIAEANQECRNVVQEKLGDLGQQIKSLKQTRQGIVGYSNRIVREAVFIDAKK